jgi:hypothetical protein
LSSTFPEIKEFGATAALIAAMLVTRESSATTGRLLVFLHTFVKQHAFQTALEAALPGCEVTAVGRIIDFERVLAKGVDAVLTLPVVMAAFNLQPQVQGSLDGSAEEKYSLVAVGTIPEPERVVTVGALDVLGRDGTASFVRSLLGASTRVERVVKLEDLLRLLQAQAVDAVLLPSRVLPEMRQTSRLSLTPRELTRRVGLPAAVATSSSGSLILAAIRRMPAQVARTFGVDAWR